MSDRTPMLSWRFAAPIVVWLALLLIPHPTGLSPIAWRYLGLFAGVIVALVLEPLPPGREWASLREPRQGAGRRRPF